MEIMSTFESLYVKFTKNNGMFEFFSQKHPISKKNLKQSSRSEDIVDLKTNCFRAFFFVKTMSFAKQIYFDRLLGYLLGKCH